MIKPDKNTCIALANEFSMIPICEEIYADVITPITLLRRIAKTQKRYYLLESIEGGEKWGRYSFLGFDPILRLTCVNHKVTIENGEKKQVKADDPYDVLRQVMAEYQSPKLPGFPPFTGGLIGYFAYGMYAYAEPKLQLRPSGFADFDLMLYDKVIAYDHLTQKISVIVNVKTDRFAENYQTACNEIDKIINLIKDPVPLPEVHTKSKPSFSCNTTAEDYTAMVNAAKTHIQNGDIFQAVLSRRFETVYDDSLIGAYRVLRTTNPSPYMVYLKADDVEVISTSPETLVKLQGDTLTTFPVAGSRPRGKTAADDQVLEAELLQDEKELAEHNMLVDLARNDLGRIAEFGSVHVANYQMVHRYSKIMHLTSEVEGKLKNGLDAFSALKSVLPAGTLSGAPKLRACQIIEKLEKAPRGIYGGAIGYIDFSGNLDTCIAIRMAVKKDGRVYVQAGGGIVADSDPKSEYEESANKAKAIIDAIINAAEVDD